MKAALSSVATLPQADAQAPSANYANVFECIPHPRDRAPLVLVKRLALQRCIERREVHRHRRDERHQHLACPISTG